MIIRYFTTNKKKIRLEDQLSEPWTVDSGLWTIIRMRNIPIEALA